MNPTAGTLYIVATPIGNLQDMTLRAIETLKSVDKIAAEDTRHSLALLQHFAIQKPLIALHEHNEREQSEKLIAWLQAGKSLALISDAGTPLLSDPGFYLVRKAREAGITVVPIPGACAAIAALCVSGLPPDAFIFSGFLPAKSEPRRQCLVDMQFETRTLIFYEAPHRVLATIKDMHNVLGPERKVVIARELTKLHETVVEHSLAEWMTLLDAQDKQRGEFVLVVAGAEKQADANNEKKAISSQHVLSVLLKSLPLKQAVQLAAKITDERKNALYERALQLDKK